MKRTIIEILIALTIVAIFMTESYKFLPPPMQAVALKALLTSMGALHAHLFRKFFFPKVRWDSTQITGGVYVSIAIYVIFIYSYSTGG
jgi:CBS-domain-containing membrane protein